MINKRKIILACALNGLMFGGIKWVYELSPMPMTLLLYCTFLGFTVTSCVGAKAEKAGIYLCNFAIGFLWAMGYMGAEYILLLLPLSIIMAKTAAFGIVSFLIEITNILLPNKNEIWFAPLQFAVIIGIFSQQGNHIPYVVLALVIGMLAALLSKKIYQNIL